MIQLRPFVANGDVVRNHLHRHQGVRRLLTVAFGASAIWLAACERDFEHVPEAPESTLYEVDPPKIVGLEVFDPVAGRIVGAVLGGGGAMYVADLQANNILEIRGGKNRTFGNPGDGPGEFRMITGLAMDGDTLIAFDSEASRFTFIPVAGDTGAARTATLDAADGMHAFGAPILGVGGSLLLGRSLPSVDYQKVNQGRLHLTEYGRDGEVVSDSLFSAPGKEWLITPGRTSGYTVEPMPFGKEPFVRFAAGRMYFLWSGTPELLIVNLSTSDTIRVPLPLKNRLVGDQDVKAYVESITGDLPTMVSRQRERTLVARDEGRLPTTYPIAEDMLLDDHGRVWIQLVPMDASLTAGQFGAKYVSGRGGVDVLIVDFENGAYSRLWIPDVDALYDLQDQLILGRTTDSLGVQRLAKISFIEPEGSK